MQVVDEAVRRKGGRSLAWKESEVETLRKMAAEGHHSHTISEALPGRDPYAVRKKATALGLKIPMKNGGEWRPWTKKEVAYLHYYTEAVPTAQPLAKHLKRSVTSVQRKIAELGLSLGCALISLKAAVARSGYSTETIRHAARATGTSFKRGRYWKTTKVQALYLSEDQFETICEWLRLNHSEANQPEYPGHWVRVNTGDGVRLHWRFPTIRSCDFYGKHKGKPISSRRVPILGYWKRVGANGRGESNIALKWHFKLCEPCQNNHKNSATPPGWTSPKVRINESA